MEKEEVYRLETKIIRLLRADEIECRVAIINEKGLSLLLFKDARVDQRILDETFTPFGWRRSHQSIDGNLYCTVEIWDSDKEQWIAKQDVGTMSYSEKEKGQASDSFKRACFNWGIGRELYTAPFIWIPVDKVKIQPKDHKFITTEHFRVKKISYNENREISYLEIQNSNNQTVFLKGVGSTKTAEEVKSALDKKARDDFYRELERTGVAMEQVLRRYQISDLSEMTPVIYSNVMRDLRKSKTKAA